MEGINELVELNYTYICSIIYTLVDETDLFLWVSHEKAELQITRAKPYICVSRMYEPEASR